MQTQNSIPLTDLAVRREEYLDRIVDDSFGLSNRAFNIISFMGKPLEGNQYAKPKVRDVVSIVLQSPLRSRYKIGPKMSMEISDRIIKPLLELYPEFK